MPTVIVLDTSVHMGIKCEHDEEKATKLQLAAHGLNTLLDFIASYSKLEFVALVTFGSHCTVVSTFTRELDFLRSKIKQLRPHENCILEPALFAVEKLVVGEWGLATPCNIILVTQDRIILPRGYTIPFSFPATFLIVLLSNNMNSRIIRTSMEAFDCSPLKVYQPRFPIALSSVQSVFLNISEEFYSLYIGQLICGNFSSKVTLSPPPMSYTKTTDFDSCLYKVNNVMEICGFIELQYLGSPAAVSRHLILPCCSSILQGNLNSPQSDFEDDMVEEGHTPSFCVLLHGALKVENMAALCNIGKDWYGVLYSWADSKKKSNLMLSILEPGTDSVPWLGDLNCMMIPANSNSGENFPLRQIEKRSYSQNCIAWIRQPGLQSDIQKILRHARKIPDKTQQFYKELNRVRKAAVSLGFISLIDGLADVLDRECILLPGSAHPASAFQLTHAASILREPCCKDPKYTIMPMKMSFN